MKTLCYRALLLCAIAGLSACSSYNYYTAGLNKTNMSGYHSFAWLSAQGKRNTSNSAYDLKIKDAAVASLSAKGLRLQNNDPDLLVTYSAKVGQGSKTVMTSTYYGGGGFYPYAGFGWGYGWGWGGWYSPYYGFGSPFTYYGGYTATGREHYKEGTIIIDLIDSRTHKIVWRGFGVGDAHKNPQKDIDDLPKVVSGIIDQLQLTPSRRT